MATFAYDFSVELLKTCLINTKIMDIVSAHLEYYYFNTEAQKTVFKFTLDYKKLHDCAPSVGIISQSVSQKPDVVEFLSRVKEVKITKSFENSILTELESFIKKSRFVSLFEETQEMYNKGAHEDAIVFMYKESEKINDFNIKDKYYTSIFGGFEDRHASRLNQELDSLEANDRISFGIPELDNYTGGGMRRKTSTLVMARSGGGKSTFLRWIGAYNAQLGKRVVHFQAEGSKDECEVGYDACWTGMTMDDIEQGNIMPDSMIKILKAKNQILARKGEVLVYASESFDSMSLEDCYNVLSDIVKIFGPIDLILFDYLELFAVKGKEVGSESAERKRREKISNKVTNLAVEFNASSLGATQAQNITEAQYNKSDFVLTREHISEHKGMVKPFSNFLTINQTDDERTSSVARIYGDKFRRNEPNQTFTICQSMEIGRFVNLKKTKELNT